MTTAKSQRKWRDKNRYVKTQLNVMARKLTHGWLDDLTRDFALRGKGEAVTFAAFVTMALRQRAAFDPQAAEMLDLFVETYRQDRDVYAA